jgi:hypothetical protein
MNERSVEALVDLGSKARYMNVDDIRLGVEMVIPDVLEKHRAGDDLAGMPDQVFKKPELARLQRDLLRAARHAMGQPVEHEVAHCIARRFAPTGVSAAAGQDLDPSEKL